MVPSSGAATPVAPSDPAAPKQAQKSRRAESLREADRKALAAAMAEEAARPDVPTHIVVGGIDPPAERKNWKSRKSNREIGGTRPAYRS